MRRFLLTLSATLLLLAMAVPVTAENITFADSKVKAICIANWDTNGDGELSVAEAAAVTDLGTVFKSNYNIKTFDELQYFTGLTSIGNLAFNFCTGLTNITIPSSVTSIDNRAFVYCSKLTSITIPRSVISISYDAFQNCSSLTSLIVESENANFDSRDNCNAIIRKSDNTLIAGCKNTIIPSSVTSIGDRAFDGCSGLTTITIPSSVTSIGSYAFSGCSGLTTITIPSSVTSIASSAFANCSSLATISVETENPYFDSRDNCNAIIKKSNNTLIAGCKTTTIPNSVTSIGSFAFYECSGLTDITIPSSVTSIDFFSFAYCDNLAAVKLESTTPVTISQYSFSGCDNAVLYVPKGSKDVYLAADYWKDFKEIVEYQFDIIFDDANVKAVCVANWDTDGNGELSIREAAEVTALGTVFKGKESISSFNELQHFTGIKFIGNSAFEGCSNLTSIIIPCNVTSIGSGAFNGCSNLSVVKMENATPVSITENVFSNRTNTTLYVMFGSKAAYQVADYWKEFKEIVEYDVDITFEDTKVKALCIANWDTNGDGELSMSEAAAVTDLGTVFKSNYNIKTFDELQYFTGLTSIGKRAFDFCTGLTNITIPSSVTSIDNRAFDYCSKLTSITIPRSVISISYDAFQNCSSLTSLIVESENANFDSRDNCNAIIRKSDNTLIMGCKTTTIPNSVTSIGDYAFNGCSGLTSITIPSSVTSIGSLIFSGCSSLTSITVESGNVNYDSRDNCNAIIRKSDNTLIAGCKNTIIPSSVTSIGDYAFYDCSGLTSITIPSSVTSIGDYAFYDCSGLTSITIPSSVTEIGSYAFYSCSGLTSVTIPSSVTSIGDDAFRNCSGLTSISVESGNVNYDSRDNCNAIIRKSDNTLIMGCKTTTIPNSVTSIGDYAFNGCSGLTSITIPSSVTEIGSYAFSDCSGLTAITIPSSVTAIGDDAFYYCSGLTSIEIPSSVTSIGSWAFYGCSKLATVVVKNATPAEISSYVFSNPKNATLYVPKGSKAAYEAADYWKEFKEIKEFGEEEAEPQVDENITFADENVKAICVANWDSNGDGELSMSEAKAVKTIGTIFRGNSISSFDELQYFKGLTSLDENAFKSCSNLTSFTFPSSITSIGSYAFSKCTSLTSIFIPSSITEIGTNPFNACSSVTSISVDSKNTHYDSRDNCNAIIRKSDNTLVSGCKNTVIPNSVTSIGENAFTFCIDLTTITIPSNVTSIGDNAFMYCDNLVSVIVENVNPAPITEYVFTNRESTTLYVMFGSKAAYEAADYWKEFKEIVEEKGGDYILGDVNGNGSVDIGDAVSIVNYLVGKESAVFVEAAADTNKNGGVDIGDAVTIVNFLVGKTTSLSRTIDNVWDEKEPQ